MTTAADTGAPRPFDVRVGVGDHTTVLEASAGTGKTYAIVGVAARSIIEGTSIDKLLLVTFSRSATAELRERMRSRLWHLVAAIDAAVARTDSPVDGCAATTARDELLDMVLDGDTDEIALRRDRLARALSDFDASTIATTHTFCNRMLEALGFLGERELISEIVEDVDDLVEDTAVDLFMQGFARDPDGPAFDLADALVIAKEATRHPAARLAPAEEPTNGDADDRLAARRVRFCTRLREIVGRRKREARVRTYDDLQLILHAIVTDDRVGEDARERIRSAFDLVLVDEFQDTDPQQWDILRLCFHGHRRLVLVGDPKQSIYAFRGAEVLSYLDAVGVADDRRALDRNYRSDADLVDALYRVYGGANLGNSQITVHPVAASRRGSRMRGPGATPLRLRWFDTDDFPVTQGRSQFAAVGAVRDAVPPDVPADTARLLESATEIEVDGTFRPVHPGDIAILVAANKTIEPLQRALAAHGVGSVVGTGTSIFATMSARHWLWLIRAIESPSRTDRVALAALTPLIGWTPALLADADDTAVTELAAELSDLARVFDQGGFAALVQRVLGDRGVAARVLATDDGERDLTDLMQVATVCNRYTTEQDCGLSSVQEWLADRIEDVSRWRRSDEQTRRLDRDTHVVQIMTVHASKGLQFPIVYVPFGWDGTKIPSPRTFRYHDDSGRRYLDVGGPNTTGRSERLRRSMSEDAGEDLRKFYVALTRAASQVVLWWAPSKGTPDSALHRLVFGRSPGFLVPGTDIPERASIPDRDECAHRLHQLGAGTDTIGVERAGGATPRRWHAEDADAPPGRLSAAVFGGHIDTTWQRTSYSAIIAGAAHGTAVDVATPDVGSERDADVVDDEPDYAVDEPGATTVSEEPGQATVSDETGASLMNGMPFGAAFGTLVHEVLEYVDTTADDRAVHVRELCDRSAARYALAVDVAALAEALEAVLCTPLGFGDLWSIGTRDRLAELDFEIPLGGGGGAATLGAVADAMRRLLPADDPLRDYAEILGELPDRRLRGYLTGSIDSVLRTPQGRFVIVDYKTNRLRPGRLTAADFSADAMAAEMIGSHYPLQALLYSVALHRYLRWRLPGYEPAIHLGPVQYHFVRGMIGPRTPPGCGVFEWNVPPELITVLSSLLAEGTR